MCIIHCLNNYKMIKGINYVSLFVNKVRAFMFTHRNAKENYSKLSKPLELLFLL